ncbi:MAG: PLD nuclease N-terminal domain-containing protein [Silicimonas sp.]
MLQYLQYLGLWLLIALTFNMWAWLSVIRARPGPVRLVLWTLVLACLPVIGFVAWFLLGPREARS